jgi:hypothetical protein
MKLNLSSRARKTVGTPERRAGRFVTTVLAARNDAVPSAITAALAPRA